MSRLGTADELGDRLARALGLDAPEVLPAEDAQGTVCVDVPRAQWVAALVAARDELGLDKIGRAHV